jgi:hypothetical protein
MCDAVFSYKSVASTFQNNLLPPSPNAGKFLPEYTASSHKTVIFEYSNCFYMRTKYIYNNDGAKDDDAFCVLRKLHHAITIEMDKNNYLQVAFNLMAKVSSMYDIK